MLPTNEIDTLTMTVVEAMDLAAEGKVADGFSCLVWELHRAEDIAEEGNGWGPELVERWRLACDNYSERYGVRLD